MSEETLFGNPDAESLAKTRFASYYFGLFMKIIDSIRKRKFPGRRIVYADFFAGPGKYKSNQYSVPLKVLGASFNFENVHYYLNDIRYSEELTRNILQFLNAPSLPKNIEIHGFDARDIDVRSVFEKDDIVISYVDSMSYMMCDIETMSFLLSNPFSDSLMFLNTEHFARMIHSPSERTNFIKYFGGVENMERFCRHRDEGHKLDEITNWLLQDFIKRLNQRMRKSLNYLPIFFRKSNSESPVSHFLLIISKNDIGIKAIRESFTEVSEEEDERGQRAENFRFENNRIFVYEEPARDQMSIFDENFHKYAPIKRFIPDQRSGAINCAELLNIIDIHYVKERHYLSGYSQKYLRGALSYFEDNNIIEIVYSKRRKRPKNTFGSNTRFYLIKETNP